MLAYIVAAVGVLIGMIGVSVVVFPAPMRELVTLVQSPKVIYGAVTFRIVAGAFFIIASNTCAWPLAIGTIGVLILVAGLAGLFIGTQRIETMMKWFLKLSDAVWRGWALIAVMLGGFIVYAAV